MNCRFTLYPMMIIATGMILILACGRDKRRDSGENVPLPDRPVNDQPIATQASQIGILDVRADLSDAGVLLHIENLPTGATLECDLDDKPIIPCHHGALFAKPVAGDHKIIATAMLQGNVVAIGESEPFTITTDQFSGAVADQNDPLAVQVVNQDFARGMSLSTNQPYTFSFKLSKSPTCNAELYCRYGSENSSFWAICDDAGALQFTIEPGLMAMGRQSLAVQARCGDQIGPTITTHWYGVEEGYTPLTLRSLSDPEGKTFLYLMKADYCPPTQLTFECSDSKTPDDWGLCLGNNTLENAASGTRARASCDGRKGPVLTLTASGE